MNFPFTLYQENILIMGMQGTGKTTLCRQLLESQVLFSAPRFIWSPQKPHENYGQYGEPIADLAKLKDTKATYWVGDFSKSTFEKICKHIMAFCHNMIIIVDDVHEQVTKHNIKPNFSKIINSGRNRGLSCIFLSPYPNLITSQILQAARHRFCFRLDLESQVIWAERNIFGPDAWLLVPRDLRQKDPAQRQELDTMPPHSYIYRFDGHIENQIVIQNE